MTLVPPGCTWWDRVEDWRLLRESDASTLDAAFPVDPFAPSVRASRSRHGAMRGLARSPRGLETTKDAIRKYLGDSTNTLRFRFEGLAESGHENTLGPNKRETNQAISPGFLTR